MDKPIHINYKNGFETIFDGEITGFTTRFIFIPLGDEFPVASTTNLREFEFEDGTIWEGYIHNIWNDVKWQYGKHNELIGICQKVSIQYTIRHEGKESKLKRFKFYGKIALDK